MQNSLQPRKDPINTAPPRAYPSTFLLHVESQNYSAAMIAKYARCINALDHTKPVKSSSERYHPDDKLLAFLEAL